MFATITNNHPYHHQQQQVRRSETVRWRLVITSTHVTVARHTACLDVYLLSTRSNEASSVFVQPISLTCLTSVISWSTRLPSLSTKLSSILSFLDHNAYDTRSGMSYIISYQKSGAGFLERVMRSGTVVF